MVKLNPGTSQSQMIEVVGKVINPEFQRWGETVLAEVDCNGENQKENAVLFGLLPDPSQIQGENSEDPTRGEGFEFTSLPFSPPSRIRRAKHGVITFKGPSDEDPESEYRLNPDRTYRFYGRLSFYKNKKTQQDEPQFIFTTFIKVQPHGEHGTKRYLMDLPHIGVGVAGILWNKFQGEAVRILRESPEIVAVAVNSAGNHSFTAAKAEEAAAVARMHQAMEACTIDLLDLLAGRGFIKSTGQALIRRYGNRAAEIIRNDPHKMRGLPSCGFKKRDKLFTDQGGDPNSKKRQGLAVLHVLESNKSDTWMDAQDVVAEVHRQGLINNVVFRAKTAIRFAKLAGLIVLQRIVDESTGKTTVLLAERRRAAQERHLTGKVVAMLSAGWPRIWPDLSSLVGKLPENERPSRHQLEELAKATRQPLGILHGGPGCGKSFATVALIRMIEMVHGAGSVAVCALSGQAAARLNADLVKYKCGMRAKTIVATLGLSRGKRPKDKHGEEILRDWESKFKFERGPDNPLDKKFLFIDEGFMPDTELMCSLLMAIGRGTNVLIIGDEGQLPPIQHGRPASDMMTAGVPTGNLSEPQRNAGTIVYAYQDIRAGLPFRWNTDEEFDPTATPPRNLRVIECATPGMQLAKLFKQLDWAKSAGLDPIWDVQVIIAVNNNSPLSRKVINAKLQEKLNPCGKTVKGNPFRVGDKVVCTENGNYTCEDKNAPWADENGQCRVENGSVGRVLSVEEKTTVIEFFAPKRIVKFGHYFRKDKAVNPNQGRGVNDPEKSLPGDDGDVSDTDDVKEENETGCNVVLNYAGTCHGIQGGERKYVIVTIDEYPGARRICSAEWLTTAITRGKWATDVIGKEATAQAMCRNKALPKRVTRLKEELDKKLWGDLFDAEIQD